MPPPPPPAAARAPLPLQRQQVTGQGRANGSNGGGSYGRGGNGGRKQKGVGFSDDKVGCPDSCFVLCLTLISCCVLVQTVNDLQRWPAQSGGPASAYCPT